MWFFIIRSMNSSLIINLCFRWRVKTSQLWPAARSRTLMMMTMKKTTTTKRRIMVRCVAKSLKNIRIVQITKKRNAIVKKAVPNGLAFALNSEPDVMLLVVVVRHVRIFSMNWIISLVTTKSIRQILALPIGLLGKWKNQLHWEKSIVKNYDKQFWNVPGFLSLCQIDRNDAFVVWYSASNLNFDPEFKRWMKKGKRLRPEKQLDHMQQLFRILLSKRNLAYQYYSFCTGDAMSDNCSWHCIRCRKCLPWRTWHCGVCDKCRWTFSTCLKKLLHLLIC